MKKILPTIVGFMVFLPALVFAEDWKPFGTDAAGSSYSYDSQSIAVGEKTTKVSVKVMLSHGAQEETKTKFNEYGGMATVSYCIDKLEVHCIAHMSRIISRVWYSSEGNAIVHHDYSSSQFENAVPASLMGSLIESVCMKGGQPTMGQ